MLDIVDIGKNGNRYANFVQNDNDLTRRKRQMQKLVRIVVCELCAVAKKKVVLVVNKPIR